MQRWIKRWGVKRGRPKDSTTVQHSIAASMRRTERNQRDDEMRSLMLDQGWTYRQVADKYGVTRQRVQQIVGKVGYRNSQRMREITQTIEWAAEIIRSMSQDGFDFKEISEVTGIDEATMAVIRRRMKIPRTSKRITHGTRTGYNRGCRCVECKAAAAKRMREYTWNQRRAAGKPIRKSGPPRKYL